MNISHQVIQSNTHLLKLNRPLSGRWAGEIEQTFKELSKNGVERVIFDMEDVPFIDSHGLSALVSGWKTLKECGKNLHLASPQAQPQLVFQLTGYDRVFSIMNASKEFVDV